MWSRVGPGAARGDGDEHTDSRHSPGVDGTGGRFHMEDQGKEQEFEFVGNRAAFLR